MAGITKAVKADPQFQALVAVLGSQVKAKAAFDRINQPAEEVKSELQQLLDAGFTQEQAEKALGTPLSDKPVSLVKAGDRPAAVVEETAKEKTARQVAEAGLVFAKGRVYVTKPIIEAVARTLRNGQAQIVQASGNGRVSHVLVAKEESGDVSIQNLATQS